MNLFELYASLTLDTGEYEQGLTGAETRFQSFSEHFDGLLTGAEQRLSGTLTGIPAVFVTLQEEVTEKVQSTSQSVLETFDRMCQGILEGCGSLLAGTLRSFGAIQTGIAETVASAAQAARAQFEAIERAVAEKTGAARAAAEDGFAGILASVTEKTGRAAAVVDQGFQAVYTAIAERLGAADSAASARFASIQETAAEKLESARSAVNQTLTFIQTDFSDKLGAARAAAEGIFEGIRSGMVEKITGAKDAVGSVIEAMKGLFRFSWSLPHLALPHLSVSGSFSLNPPSVPSFSIAWYRKAMDNAMLLNSPTIFGIRGNTLLGAGEAGPEVVSGADTLMNMIREAAGTGNEEILSLLRRILETINQADSTVQIQLDGNQLAQAVFDPLARYARSVGTPIGG